MTCILLWSSAVRVHDSQAYRKMDVTRERISRILWLYSTQVRGYLLHRIRRNVAVLFTGERLPSSLYRTVAVLCIGKRLPSLLYRGTVAVLYTGKRLPTSLYQRERSFALHKYEATFFTLSKGTWLYSTQVSGYLLQSIRGNVAVLYTGKGQPSFIYQATFFNLSAGTCLYCTEVRGYHLRSIGKNTAVLYTGMRLPFSIYQATFFNLSERRWPCSTQVREYFAVLYGGMRLPGCTVHR